MRKTMQFSRLFLLACALFVYACKKSDNAPIDAAASNAELAAKVMAYLEKQKSPANQSRNGKIQALENALNFPGLWTEKLNEKERLVVVPVTGQSLQLMDNKDKHPLTHLVLLLSAEGSITKANIIQYVPKTGQAADLPANTFSKIFSYQNIDCDGQFTVLTLAGLYKYDLRFEAGKLREFREPLKKESDIVQRTNDQNCSHWYLAHYIIWSDGSITLAEVEDLGVVCDNCGTIGPNGQGTLCDELEGSGGGGDIEYFTNKDVSWSLGVAPIGRFIGDLVSIEKLTGNTDRIIGISHVSDAAVNAVGVSSPHYAVWHPLSIDPKVLSAGPGVPANYAAKCTIKGYLTFKGDPDDPNGYGDQYVEDVKVWTAPNVSW